MTPYQLVRNHKLDSSRYPLYLRAIKIAVIGNGLLVLLKGGAAWLSGSTAVLATAVDSLTDILYTIFLTWGLWLSQQPADESHPQGHARFEPLISVVIGSMMGVAGFEVIRRAVGQLFGEPAIFEWGLPVVVLISSGAIKVIMYHLVHRIAKSTKSPAIAASARDNLSDVFSSAAALVGVLASEWMHPLADPIAGIVVSLWIFRNVYSILVENVGYLTGKAADPALVNRIHQIASSVEGVVRVHQVVVDYLGPQLRVDMHVEVNGEIPFHAAHVISDAVQRMVETMDEVDQAYIHLEPAEPAAAPGSER